MDIRLSGVVVRLRDPARLLFRIPRFEIPTGRKLLIHGSSGIGKTTLLHLLAGLFPPDEGEVWLGEHALHALDDAARSGLRRRHVGLVFQKLNLLDHLTAAENVRLARRDASPEQVEGALARVGMADKAGQRSAGLSLGEQQRVAVARVLAAAPELLLADEPTSSLDDANTEAVMDALFEAADGRTLVVVSHDHRLAPRFRHTLRFDDLAEVPAAA